MITCSLRYRYPDDPYDRIWESDSLKRANYLVDVAPGTERISTAMPIDVNNDERPPVKVMQTAVVGQNGTLNYRLNLNGFPGYGWAFCYFAEIEDLGVNEIRKFKLVLPGNKELTRLIVNVQENAQGKYYTSQQLTVKSDVYSYGIILLELISGQEPISNTSFGESFRNITQWAKFHCESGEIEAIIDPSVRDGYNDIQSVWKVAEVAVRCVNLEMRNRPAMSEVLKEIQEAIALEQAPTNTQPNNLFGEVYLDALNNPGPDAYSSDSFTQPELR
ncbi:hypothetical protein B296_00007615 [Ensete ventricosum]|uniref:Protein kinase domain-containing protein n=1 Tax=Ensete ventricosum TaxID=4639 RepID=A0A427AIU9_ENSVE|nr:hypothetical protein B296_00007615 [Ensete ventricosum]